MRDRSAENNEVDWLAGIEKPTSLPKVKLDDKQMFAFYSATADEQWGHGHIPGTSTMYTHISAFDDDDNGWPDSQRVGIIEVAGDGTACVPVERALLLSMDPTRYWLSERCGGLKRWRPK